VYKSNQVFCRRVEYPHEICFGSDPGAESRTGAAASSWANRPPKTTRSCQRQRAHAVLLSADGYPLKQLVGLLHADRDTISGWLEAWQQKGLDGLADAPKPGRPRMMDADLEAELLELLTHPTPALKALVQAHLKKKTNRSPGPL